MGLQKLLYEQPLSYKYAAIKKKGIKKIHWQAKHGTEINKDNVVRETWWVCRV